MILLSWDVEIAHWHSRFFISRFEHVEFAHWHSQIECAHWHSRFVHVLEFAHWHSPISVLSLYIGILEFLF